MLLIFNDVSGSEVILILVFVLIFFGSKSIPGLARTMGRTIRQIKDASADIQREIRKSGADMKNDLDLTGLIRDTAEDIKRPLDQHVQDIENAVRYEPPKLHSHIPVPAPVDTATPGEKKEDETAVQNTTTPAAPEKDDQKS